MGERMPIENCRKCVDYLLDKQIDDDGRIAAAESLRFCRCQEAKDALFHVLIDESEPDYLRSEAAYSLGQIWDETHIEYGRLVRLMDSPYLNEVLENLKSLATS